ncbi:MAG TPA: CaiB/BaiF CoA-transferase family protein [Terrimesophilobacter sp.]|jgi:Predicted acyl-CoA transferases/carnitine dehydratase|uniref:CaiB/BaiF CoA transferase family protein n=1 Tax=Terrimesophilobacter sp. TaxID=2906435 RepID=UPI002F95FAB7
MSQPLDGITVVALEQAVAAPFATRQLADLGARVIKIERDSGDFARGYDASVKGMASYFVWLNRGKESVVMDLKQPDDFAMLKRIVAEADVLVQNLAPGALDRLGLTAKIAHELNPRLIYVSISGYGEGGDYEKKKAYDLLVQCESGLLSVTGTEDVPAKAGISIADISAGMYAFSGVLTALIQRGKTGLGDNLEVSMLEAMGEWMSQPTYLAKYSGSGPGRTGAQHATIAPYGPFAVLDGSVFLAVQNEREWKRFCGLVLGRPEVATDPRFLSNTLRVENRAELHSIIEGVFARFTLSESIDVLEDAQIASAQLRTMSDFAEHPQLKARNRWRDIDSPVGTLSVLLPPVTSTNMEPVMGAVPSIGQHTESIRREFDL